MSSVLTDMTWVQRAAHYKALNEYFTQQGNTRDAEFADVNRKTCLLMAIEDGEISE